jgi:hypothetical protein
MQLDHALQAPASKASIAVPHRLLGTLSPLSDSGNVLSTNHFHISFNFIILIFIHAPSCPQQIKPDAENWHPMHSPIWYKPEAQTKELPRHAYGALFEISDLDRPIQKGGCSILVKHPANLVSTRQHSKMHLWKHQNSR